MFKIKSELLDQKKISKAISRISFEICEKFSSLDNLAIVGIKTRGEILANRIVGNLHSNSKVKIDCGILNVTFYRDDFSSNLGSPKIGPSEIDFDVNNRNIILVDDVLYTGRTIRAAMNEIFSFGRPNSIKLAVLVDRGHREVPIKADFVGKNYPTSDNEHIHVQVNEVDSDEKVILVEY